VRVAEFAALARAEVITVAELLAGNGAVLGRYEIAGRSVAMEPTKFEAVMDALRANPPSEIAGVKVTSVEDHPEANLLRFQSGDRARVQVRPSGTEPKVKVYVEVIDGDPQPLADAMASLVSGMG